MSTKRVDRGLYKMVLLTVFLLAFSNLGPVHAEKSDAKEEPAGERFVVLSTGGEPIELDSIESTSALEPPRAISPYIPKALAKHSLSIQKPTIVIGPDERSEVSPVQYPYTAIVKIKFFDGTINSGCTGWLVGISVVVTAAHCMFDIPTRLTSSNYEVIPAYNGLSSPSSPYGSCPVLHALPQPAYLSETDPIEAIDKGFDWGILLLGCKVGLATGTFGIEVLSTLNQGEPIVAAGYPGDLQGGEIMYKSPGSAIGIENFSVYYDNDMAGGQSGAPVWRLAAQNLVAGIHVTGQTDAYNQATQITPFIAGELGRFYTFTPYQIFLPALAR